MPSYLQVSHNFNQKVVNSKHDIIDLTEEDSDDIIYVETTRERCPSIIEVYNTAVDSSCEMDTYPSVGTSMLEEFLRGIPNDYSFVELKEMDEKPSQQASTTVDEISPTSSITTVSNAIEDDAYPEVAPMEIDTAVDLEEKEQLMENENIADTRPRQLSPSIEIVCEKVLVASTEASSKPVKPEPFECNSSYVVDPSLIELAQKCLKSTTSKVKIVDQEAVSTIDKTLDEPLPSEPTQTVVREVVPVRTPSLLLVFPGPLSPPPTPPVLEKVSEPGSPGITSISSAIPTSQPMVEIVRPTPLLPVGQKNRNVQVRRQGLSMSTPERPQVVPPFNEWLLCFVQNYQQNHVNGPMRTEKCTQERSASSGEVRKTWNSRTTVFAYDELAVICLLSAPAGAASLPEMYSFLLKHFSGFELSPKSSWRIRLRDTINANPQYFLKTQESNGSLKSKDVYKLAEESREMLAQKLYERVNQNINAIETLRMRNSDDLYNLLTGNAKFQTTADILKYSLQRNTTVPRNITPVFRKNDLNNLLTGNAKFQTTADILKYSLQRNTTVPRNITPVFRKSPY